MSVRGWDPAATMFERSISPVSGPIFICHIARDCHPFTYFRTVLLYMCYSLVICTINCLTFLERQRPVGLWKRLSTYCTLPSYISLIPNSPQLTEVSKFFSTILAAAWCDVSISQMHQPADPTQRKYFEIEHISKTLVARLIINQHTA